MYGNVKIHVNVSKQEQVNCQFLPQRLKVNGWLHIMWALGCHSFLVLQHFQLKISYIIELSVVHFCCCQASVRNSGALVRTTVRVLPMIWPVLISLHTKSHRLHTPHLTRHLTQDLTLRRTIRCKQSAVGQWNRMVVSIKLMLRRLGTTMMEWVWAQCWVMMQWPLVARQLSTFPACNQQHQSTLFKPWSRTNALL